MLQLFIFAETFSRCLRSFFARWLCVGERDREQAEQVLFVLDPCSGVVCGKCGQFVTPYTTKKACDVRSAS